MLMSRRKKAAVLNIGLFLSNAVHLARTQLKVGKICVFAEVPFDHEDVPGIGPIGGKLDYLASEFAGVTSLGKNFIAQVRLKTPHLLVVEAKTDATIGTLASFYQLTTQLIPVERNAF
jgi:hypothetical protein